MTRQKSRIARAAALAGALLTLSGCGAPMTGEELFDHARDVNFSYKTAVAEVQLQILDGEWRTLDYGDAPQECGIDRYEFTMSRGTTEGWRIDGTPKEAGARIADWLNDTGWTEIKTRSYSEGISDIVVEAKNLDRDVDLLIIDISPGEAFDSATIDATSTCHPGNSHELFELILPGVSTATNPKIQDDRVMEHPTAPLSFGYNPDGTPRFWNDGE